MKLIRKHMSGQKGFTLIELLVVVAILGILATIAVPRVMDAIDNARARKAEADLTVLRDALERWYLDYSIFPPSLYWLKDKMYVDPNFTFKNSYGKFYFYAVRYNGATDPTSLSDYVLGDPGKVPVTTPGVVYEKDQTPGGTDPGKLCQGLDPTATKGAYTWYLPGSAPQSLNLDGVDATHPLASWTGVVSGKTFNLAGDGSQATPDLVAYEIYTNSGGGPITPESHIKIGSPPIVYQGQQ